MLRSLVGSEMCIRDRRGGMSRPLNQPSPSLTSPGTGRFCKSSAYCAASDLVIKRFEIVLSRSSFGGGGGVHSEERLNTQFAFRAFTVENKKEPPSSRTIIGTVNRVPSIERNGLQNTLHGQWSGDAFNNCYVRRTRVFASSLRAGGGRDTIFCSGKSGARGASTLFMN